MAMLAKMADFGQKSRPFLGRCPTKNRIFFREKSKTSIDLGVVFGRIGAICDAQSLINWFLCTDFEKNSIFEKMAILAKMADFGQKSRFWPKLGPPKKNEPFLTVTGTSRARHLPNGPTPSQIRFWYFHF